MFTAMKIPAITLLAISLVIASAHTFEENRFGAIIPSKIDSAFSYNIHQKHYGTKLPEHFDAREHWPQCKSIREISNQGPDCGGCWAVSTSDAIRDRICIASNGTRTPTISALELMECIPTYVYKDEIRIREGTCYGGYPLDAWRRYVDFGLVTGDNVNRTAGCKPYTDVPKPTGCVAHCENAEYPIPYEKDHYRGASGRVLNNETGHVVEEIQWEIYKHGPVVAGFRVYPSFRHYNGEGIYQRLPNEEPTRYGHAVRVVGWGTENGTDYWIILNSWGSDWGVNQGTFRFIRGINNCNFEGFVIAGLPVL